MTEDDLRKMGMVKDANGYYRKEKTVPQPREKTPVKEVTKNVYFNNMDIQDVYAQCEKDGTIFIKGNVPSLKNSKQIFKNSKTGKSFITSSALCKQYVKDTDIHFRVFKPKFLEMIKGKDKPYRIQMFFVRDKHKAFDYINISQIIFDLMQTHGWLEDDDNRNVIPNFDCGYGYDPKMAGVIIKIL